MTHDTKQFGKYILLDKMATGGMAELYRAKLTGAKGFEKLIAIKKILRHLNFEEKLLVSFIDEAKLAAFLHHPNIVQIYDFGSVDDTYFIAMEHLAGKDLRYSLKKAEETGSRLSLELILYIISCLCDGLDYAHTLKDFSGNPLNIIHRDVGPQNLFLTYDGQVKIIDFGIAKAANQSTSTQSGTIKGKVAYMSPEQASGSPVDHRSDIFSVGIIFYELLTLVKMYEGDTFEALSKARKADFIPVSEIRPELPREIHRIVEKALEKETANRYQSAHEMYSDIENFMVDNKIRVSQRDLANYLQGLFSSESITDECKIRNYITTEKSDDVSVHPDADDDTYISEENNIGQYDSTLDIEDFESKGSRIFLFTAFSVFIVVASVYFWMEKDFYRGIKDKLIATYIDQAPRQRIPVKKFKKLVDEKRFAEAVAEFEAVLKTRPDAGVEIAPLYSESLTGIAAGMFRTDPEQAVKLLKKAKTLDGLNIDAILLLGKVFTRLKENRKAIEYYSQAAEMDRTNPDSFFNLGYNYAVLNDFGKAREMYMTVVELSPKFVDEALFNLAIINDKIGKREEAVLNLKAAIKANPKNANAKKFLTTITSD